MNKQNFSGFNITDWLLGFVVVVALASFIYWLLWQNSWNRVSPEDKARVIHERQAYADDIHHCERVVAKDVIDVNNPEFRRCATLLEKFETEMRESR